MKFDALFPFRLVGFGFYWAWLFLTVVSPSPLVGEAMWQTIPLEAWELAFRLLAIFAIIVLSGRLATERGETVLVIVSLVVGPAATMGLGLTGSFVFVILAALADASMFMLWLCFFGHMKVGETALYMALSYATGACIYIISTQLAGDGLLAVDMILPMLSTFAFLLSNKFYSRRTGDPPMFSEHSFTAAEKELIEFPYMTKMAVALGCYAMLFGLVTSIGLTTGISGVIAGPFIEAPCCLVLGLGIAVATQNSKALRNLQVLYKFVPLLFAIGYAILLFADSALFVVASAFVMFGYLTFEINALNDFCNAVKTRNLSLLKAFGIARAALTLGMLTGWLLGWAMQWLPESVPATHVGTGIAACVVALVPTFIFTEKEFLSVRGIADSSTIREMEESTVSGVSEMEEALLSFGEEWGLSRREMEVLDLLLKGRTIQYIASQLFIAPGTAKSHVYNIYRKLDVHTKMDLFDAFEAFRDNRDD